MNEIGWMEKRFFNHKREDRIVAGILALRSHLPQEESL